MSFFRSRAQLGTILALASGNYKPCGRSHMRAGGRDKSLRASPEYHEIPKADIRSSGNKLEKVKRPPGDEAASEMDKVGRVGFRALIH